jgi:mitochondrial fission protein ELM1
LASADQFVVISDSERTMADVCATDKPVTICDLPPRGVGLRERFRAAVLALAKAPRANDRGTVRPQQGLEYWCSSLIAKGYVRPPHDSRRMKRRLVECGVARLYGDPPLENEFTPLRELKRAADRVRTLIGVVGS